MSASCGRFLVLDGVEGCGKSTHARLLAEHLREQGHRAVLTHEPGGTPLGVELRELLLHRGLERTALTETFLFCADRAEHLAQVIVPALAAGQWVICDRFSSATYAYQVAAGGLDEDTFLRLDSVARRALSSLADRETLGDQPDLTVVLDLDPEEGLRRGLDDDPSAADDFEQRSLDFHRRVRQGFRAYAERLGPRAALVDATRPVEQVHRDILRLLRLGD